ncbi:MAG TPA: 23S rRNA (pseudouridine(1915)-N(3))-methyltransferase RlmH [Flavobacteriales bacterium]|nr:23S rRNA (pseudouridine(1915)-N(3))-methyltransferase RlmH [Flavobacteriales bacterium]
MQISIIATGKTNAVWIKTGIEEYTKRMGRYSRFSFIETPNLKNKFANADAKKVMKEEAILQKKALEGVDYLILLDEHGKVYRSIEFAKHLEKLQVRGLKHLAFLIGGPYGFDTTINSMANEKWALGPLTFPHQLIRIFAVEQIYRAHTILKGEPYHHP